jgi:hypothetical protein
VLLFRQVLHAPKNYQFSQFVAVHKIRAFIMVLLHVDDRLPSLLSGPQHHIPLSSKQNHFTQPYKVLQPDFLLTLGIPVTPTPGNAFA